MCEKGQVERQADIRQAGRKAGKGNGRIKNMLLIVTKKTQQNPSGLQVVMAAGGNCVVLPARVENSRQKQTSLGLTIRETNSSEASF